MASASTLRAGLAYAQSLLSFALDGPPRPFSAAFNVTDRCNLSCEYCNFSSFVGPELLVPQVALLFDRLWTMGVRRLGLVGGEPLMRKDIGEIIQLARQRGFYISINTNLTLYGHRPDVLDDADLIFTSLDGDRQTHERNRGAHSYDGVLDAIADLRSRGKSVVAICVVREGNLGAAWALLEQGRAGGFRVHFQPQCMDTQISRGALPVTTTNSELRRFWQELASRKLSDPTLASSLLYLQAQAQWSDYHVSAVMDPHARCAAGRGFIFVDPLGNASACTFTRGQTQSVNLLEQSWATDWNRESICTRCNVGPMLEFDLLYKHPVRASLNALRGYQ